MKGGRRVDVMMMPMKEDRAILNLKDDPRG
jgi:hypothetical protein